MVDPPFGSFIFSFHKNKNFSLAKIKKSDWRAFGHIIISSLFSTIAL
jgi:hypothetical protein